MTGNSADHPRLIWGGDFPLAAKGYARRLVEEAVTNAKSSAFAWLHVDFEAHLHGFYFEACGFVPVDAGLIHLR